MASGAIRRPQSLQPLWPKVIDLESLGAETPNRSGLSSCFSPRGEVSLVVRMTNLFSGKVVCGFNLIVDRRGR